MIEVEKKFQPTEEQLNILLADSKFIEKKEISDTYWDYPDYRLLKESTRFRLRNGTFELKIHSKLGGDHEFDNEEKIKNFFKTDLDLKSFIDKNLIPLMEYQTERKKYRNGIFQIDVDRLTSKKFLDFVFDICEIELMVEEENEIGEAVKKILKFATKYNLEKYKISKKEVALRKMSPGVYEKVFENSSQDDEYNEDK